MNKFCLITSILVTICIITFSGCAVKTVDTKNINQEIEKSKKAPILEKKSAKEDTIEPPVQKSFPDKKLPSFLVEENLTPENNTDKNSESNIDDINLMENQKAIPSKEQINPFYNPNPNENVKKDTNKKFILSEKLENV